MPVLIRTKRKTRTVQKAGRNERSLGFVPFLLMTIVYLVLTTFSESIGPITSAPGFWRPEVGGIARGCIIPRAS